MAEPIAPGVESRTVDRWTLGCHTALQGQAEEEPLLGALVTPVSCLMRRFVGVPQIRLSPNPPIRFGIDRLSDEGARI